MNPNIVNRRLRDLVAADLIDRDEDKTYSLTEKGEKALEIAQKLEKL